MSNRIWTVSLIVVISMCRIGMGIYGSISGPTLMYLAENVNVRVATISAVFSAKSIGVIVGAILGGVLKRFSGPNFRHLLTLGLAVGIMGFMYLLVPWLTSFWMLACAITIGGTMYGYLDAGLQAVLLQLWGHKTSRSHIQLFHFTFSIGAFIAPQFAEPFLRKSNQLVPQNDRCPDMHEADELFNTTESQQQFINVTSAPVLMGFNPVGWCYIIAASWLIFVSCLTVALACLNVEKKVSKSMKERGLSSETRAEEPILDVLGLFLVVGAFYFCCTPAGNVIYNFVYSVTLCSDLKFSVSNASRITSVFWIGVGVGRVSGVIVSNFLKPRTILIACISCCIIDMSVMCIWGQSNAWIAWAVTGVHGYAISLLYPTCVSWISEITNVSGSYMFIFNLGNAIGSLLMLPLSGYIFDIDPFNPMYLVLSLSIGCAIFYGLALFVGKRHMHFLKCRAQLKEDNGLGEELNMYKKEITADV